MVQAKVKPNPIGRASSGTEGHRFSVVAVGGDRIQMAGRDRVFVKDDITGERLSFVFYERFQHYHPRRRGRPALEHCTYRASYSTSQPPGPCPDCGELLTQRRTAVMEPPVEEEE